MEDEGTKTPAQPAIYNPALLTMQESIALFTARRGLLDRLLDSLHRTSPGDPAQHVLLVGQRGQGKTTLLRRLAYAIEDAPELAARYIPLTFPEEQYNVGRVSDLWVNALDALADYLAARDRWLEAKEIDQAVEGLPDDESARELAARAALERWSNHTGARLLLLLDSIDLIFERLSDAHWELRSVLSSAGWLAVIGASARVLEESFDYGAAFYDFFRVEELRGLTVAESFDLMIALAQHYGAPQVERLIESDPGRFRALQSLTGGNPRTLTMLFTILASGDEGSVHEDLERLLDQCTPLYKARIEALPTQAQQVVDALATNWDPMLASEAAEAARLDVNAVSSQLSRLADQGIVERVPLPPKRRSGYQLAERFFNIWYLMRASRRARRRLTWFVEFLRLFYGDEGISERARVLLREKSPEDVQSRARTGQLALALARALGKGDLARALEVTGVSRLLDVERDLHRTVDSILDLSGEDAELKPVADRIATLREIRQKVLTGRGLPAGISPAEGWDLIGGTVALTIEQKRLVVSKLEELKPRRRNRLFAALERELRELERRLGTRVARALRQAIRDGLMQTAGDREGARAAAETLNAPALPSIAESVPVGQLDGFSADEEVIFSAQSPSFRKAIGHLGTFGYTTRDGRTHRSVMWFASGTMYSMLGANIGINLPDAEAEVRDAEKDLGRGPKSAEKWVRLGKARAVLPERSKEAEESFRRAIELDPESAETRLAYGWYLATMGDHLSEAESELERAIELDAGLAEARFMLAILYAGEGRTSEADAVLEDGITRAEDPFLAWLGMGLLRVNDPGKAELAERQLRHAAALRPSDPRPWHGIGILLLRNPEKLHEAEDAFRRAALGPLAPSARVYLGLTLQAQGKLDEAEDEFRRVLNREAGHQPDSNTVQALTGLVSLLLDRHGPTPEVEGFARRAVFFAPTSPHATLALMTVLAAGGGWDEAVEFSDRVLGGSVTVDESITWSAIVPFFRYAVSGGHAAGAADLLRQHGYDERWRPLYEALTAISEENTERLERLAPELKGPALELLVELRGHKSVSNGRSQQTSSAKPKRSRNRAERQR